MSGTSADSKKKTGTEISFCLSFGFCQMMKSIHCFTALIVRQEEETDFSQVSNAFESVERSTIRLSDHACRYGLVGTLSEILQSVGSAEYDRRAEKGLVRRYRLWLWRIDRSARVDASVTVAALRMPCFFVFFSTFAFANKLVSLGSAFPDVLTLGLEIRRPVVQHVATRIQQLRAANAESGAYGNISVLATNAMKYLPNLFEKAQLSKMFFLFPDPHFKRKNHRRRIISRTLLAVYAYLLRVGGTLYTITDVKDLADWMQSYLDQSPLFRRLSDAELADDPCATMIQNVSEEAKKVSRASGNKHMGTCL
jgi:tRNA (guanine-N(7)-)-methyltransferase